MSAKNAMVLLPSELKAIEEHKYFMSLERNAPVSIDEALGDFLQSYRGRWLQEKQQQDAQRQIQEIEKHKWYRSEEAGHDVGKRTAFEEWINRFAGSWREAEESLEANGFVAARLALETQGDPVVEAGPKLADAARRYDCDMYVHWPTMNCYSFIMNDKKYLDAKSPCFLPQFNAAGGEDIEVVATGAEAGEAVEEIKGLVAPSP
jgi:phosphotransferase system HPr-like phosphotransfer protein